VTYGNRWALNNPHVSLHIPTDSRITIPTQTKRNGQPKRPRHSVKSIISNLHLLLRVPSFRRWPLKLHFFTPEVHKAWAKCCEDATEPIRTTIPVYTDFGPAKATSGGSSIPAGSPSPWGIHALPIDYVSMKSYVEKTIGVYTFEREGDCVVCGENLQPGEGLYATCSNTGCEGTGHISCWSRHLLGSNAEEDIIPISGRCPECNGEVTWADMMTEMSLRLRGQKEISKLLKKPRKKKSAGAS